MKLRNLVSAAILAGLGAAAVPAAATIHWVPPAIPPFPADCNVEPPFTVPSRDVSGLSSSGFIVIQCWPPVTPPIFGGW